MPKKNRLTDSDIVDLVHIINKEIAFIDNAKLRDLSNNLPLYGDFLNSFQDESPCINEIKMHAIIYLKGLIEKVESLDTDDEE